MVYIEFGHAPISAMCIGWFRPHFCLSSSTKWEEWQGKWIVGQGSTKWNFCGHPVHKTILIQYYHCLPHKYYTFLFPSAKVIIGQICYQSGFHWKLEHAASLMYSSCSFSLDLIYCAGVDFQSWLPIFICFCMCYHSFGCK